MRKRIILIGIVIITILSVIGFSTYRIKNIRAENYRIQAFINELNRKTHKKTPAPSNWTDAFELLREYIEGQDPEQKCVVFFDEMPWLDTHKSGFLSAFEYFWNDFGSSVDNC